MTTIRATVRGGRLEVEEPINLPDGTELLIPVPDGSEATAEDGWDDTPEGIADWLKWYDSLEPLIVTPEEKTDTKAWLKKLGDCGVAEMERRGGDLFP